MTRPEFHGATIPPNVKPMTTAVVLPMMMKLPLNQRMSANANKDKELRRTSSLPAVGGNATIAETENDENETSCDEERPDPVYTPVPRASERP